MTRISAEICADSVCSAIEGQKGGAGRIELCANLADGGTTPALSQIQLALENLTIPLHVLIRPRGGNFVYNGIEFEAMRRDIHLCGEQQCAGVVFGILNHDGSLDIARNRQLARIARTYGMSITFHRAFDHCNNMSASLEEVIVLGCDRILTSGGMDTAPERKDILNGLIEKAAGRIIIMPGGGITEYNIAELVRATGLTEFHGSFRSYTCDADVMQTDAGRVGLAIENANKVAT